LEAGEQLFFDAHQTFWKLARKPFFFELAHNFLEAGTQTFFNTHQTFWKLARKLFLTRIKHFESWHANFFDTRTRLFVAGNINFFQKMFCHV
jgi:hypothetical protein